MKNIYIFAPSNQQKHNTMSKNEIPLPDWLKVTLKVVVYLAGLLLAGVGTTASAQMVGLI